MKKVIATGVMLGIILVLRGCETSNKENDLKHEGSSKNISVKVKSGSYVLQAGDQADEGEGYLALDISVKNSSEKSVNLSSEDFSLYDTKNNKISSRNVYSDNEEFHSFNGTNLSSGKRVEGYLVFPVDKDQKYDLQYRPVFENDDKEITLKIDASKYNDDTKSITELAEQYVSEVFLGKKIDSDKNKLQLSNDLEKAHKDFNHEFSNRIKGQFINCIPSDAELNKTVKNFEYTNQKKMKISYVMKEMFPTEAIVYVLPEVIVFEDIDIDSSVKKFVDENRDKYDDHEKASTSAEKFLLQQLPSKFDDLTARQPAYMNSEGYKVYLTGSDGKWTIDSSATSINTDFVQLSSSFMGGLSE